MLSLKNNIAAVTNAIGVKNVGLVWGLANVNWTSEEERDTFLRVLTDTSNSGVR